MLRFVYTVLLYFFTPFILLRLYWKGRHLQAYRQRIHERFSIGRVVSSRVDVWVHAVSLGETIAVAPLIDALLAQQYRVLVTNMTPTGSQYVKNRFKERVEHQYVPYDLPWSLRRFFKKINARVGIIMETELWPNLISEATRAQVPLLLINARISDKAFKHYDLVRFFFKPLLGQFKAILAQSELDAKRFIALGAPSAQVHSIGNIKFDVSTMPGHSAELDELKKAWGQSRTVFIAASTHDGEESQFLAGLMRLKAAIPDILLLIAPRHPERFKTVYALSDASGFNTALRSQPDTISAQTEVLVVDTLGELLGFYHVSDCAFVGGSLVPIGGHNVLEPIAMQTPVFCGPYMANSKAVCAQLSNAGALQCLDDIDALLAAMVELHQNPAKRLQQIANANAVLEINRGALARILETIQLTIV